MLRQLMRQKLKEETGVESHALTKLEAEAPPPAAEQEAEDDIPLPFIDAPPIAHYDAEPASDALAPQVYQALTALVQNPALAQQLETPECDPESEIERLLFEVLNKLKQAPQNNSIGLIIQWTGSPFQLQLKEIAEKAAEASVMPSASTIADVLKRLNARKLETELAGLKAKLANKEKLSDEERQRLRELQRHMHELQKKRTAIYAR